MIRFSRTKALFMNILLLDSVRILLIYALDPLLRQDDLALAYNLERDSAGCSTAP